jgi:hypothetical protein
LNTSRISSAFSGATEMKPCARLLHEDRHDLVELLGDARDFHHLLGGGQPLRIRRLCAQGR